MARLPVMIALVAGVAAASIAHGQPEAKVKVEPSRSEKTAKTGKSSAKKTAKSRSSKSSRSGKGKHARASESGKRWRGDNMPRGFTWPPSAAMTAAGKACETELDELGITWNKASAEGHINDPVEVPSMELGGITYTSMWRKGPFKLDCQLARTLAQIGAELHALGVREVKFGSVYRWSNVRTQGTTRPFLSRHALGLAMDIVSFVDDTGRVASVKPDYLKDDPLLLAVENLVNTSGKFRIVLTPRNDPRSHYDHFHVEANPSYDAP